MNQEELVQQIMAEITANLGADSRVSFNKAPAPATSAPVSEQPATAPVTAPAAMSASPVGTPQGEAMTRAQYPLSEKVPERIKSASGKSLADFNYQAVIDGTLNAEDFRISPETLEMQAQVAESVGRTAFARNLRRAAELIAIPDARLLEIYNALRPYRSTKQELLDIADELDNKYSAKVNAAWVREAADVYEQRDRLRKE
ncbi:diol dehydratase small subunit [Stomatohabitans albus]|uniref:diol dehydratase small subunit n=1 Tax=Stomatohabitans albus TaxID=3110766 RepID=UPI00300CE1E1